MSNPLASAEARQAAERIYEIECDKSERDFSLTSVEQYAAIIADSYADLVRANVRLNGLLEVFHGMCEPHRLLEMKPVSDRGGLECCMCIVERAEAAESRNRELVEALQKIKDMLPLAVNGCPGCGGRGYQSGSDHHPECDGNCELCPIEIQIQCPCEGKRVEFADIDLLAEAAINSATPKQGEGK